MNLSTKQAAREFEAISEAFTRSLKSLEVEPARFRALPLRQRKLALFEAIYKTAKEVIQELDWYDDRSNLRSKRLWDFTIDQIAQHQAIVDALIAFLCLGETAFIRPLVSYLSFPEPRWSILIDSVLRAITLEPMRGSVFRIPSDAEISAWRRWAIEHSEVPKLKDFSEILLSDIGMEDVSRHYYFRQTADSAESSSLTNRNEFFQSDWKYFDERQASFCTTALYPQLKSYEFNRFAEFIESFVLQNPTEANFNTIVACTNDWISELRLPKSSLKHTWLELLAKRDVSSRTGAILYQILVYPKKDRALAREFGKELLGEESNVFILAVVSDILAQSQTATAIYRIAKAYSDIDDFSKQARETLDDLNPIVSTTITLWIENLFSREIESLCVLGGEKDPKRRKLLIALIANMLKSNDQSLLRLRVFKYSSNPKCQMFARQIQEFHELRKPLIRQLTEGTGSGSQIVSNYLTLIRVSFDKLNRVEVTKLLTG
ncbi:MAG TPA: hypothetical protein VK557_05110 [Pyrinomonadaceae bacterium]|nr:hypothetical protein [Pyrinomonadaceae bacterium]